MSDISTLVFSQVPVYTPDGTTYLYDCYTIKVHAMYAPGLEPANPGETPAMTYAALVGCLSKPRGQLVFKDGPTTLINSPQGNFTVDAKNGPTPVNFNVKRLSPGAYSVEFEVKTFQYNCCNFLAGSADSRVDMTTPFTAIRWGETVSIDEKFASKITRKGRMWFRADVLKSLGKRADDYRYVVVGACPLRPKFLRTSEYTVTEDGLILDFSITDTETYAVPLDNLCKWEGEYRMVTVKGAAFNEEVHVRVEGNYTTSKFLLFQSAFKIASSRLSTTGLFLPGQNGKIIKGGYFLDKMHENVVELHLQVQSPNRSVTFYGMQFSRASNFNGLDPNKNNSLNDTPEKVPDPGVRGTANTLYLVANALQDPCLAQGLAQASSGGSPDTSRTLVDSTIQPAKINVVKSLTTASALYDETILADTNYLDTVMDISYEHDRHTLQMPVASDSAGAASFATVASPTLRKVITYSVETAGGQPELPVTVSDDPNEVLLGFEIVPSSLSVEADGISNNWRVTGRYVYGIRDPDKARILAGRPAWLNADIGQTEIGQGQFVSGLVSIGQTSTLNAKGVY